MDRRRGRVEMCMQAFSVRVVVPRSSPCCFATSLFPCRVRKIFATSIAQTRIIVRDACLTGHDYMLDSSSNDEVADVAGEFWQRGATAVQLLTACASMNTYSHTRSPYTQKKFLYLQPPRMICYNREKCAQGRDALGSKFSRQAHSTRGLHTCTVQDRSWPEHRPSLSVAVTGGNRSCGSGPSSVQGWATGPHWRWRWIKTPRARASTAPWEEARELAPPWCHDILVRDYAAADLRRRGWEATCQRTVTAVHRADAPVVRMSSRAVKSGIISCDPRRCIARQTIEDGGGGAAAAATAAVDQAGQQQHHPLAASAPWPDDALRANRTLR